MELFLEWVKHSKLQKWNGNIVKMSGENIYVGKIHDSMGGEKKKLSWLHL